MISPQGLRRLRTLAGLSLDELGRRLQTDRWRVLRYEKNHTYSKLTPVEADQGAIVAYCQAEANYDEALGVMRQHGIPIPSSKQEVAS